MDSGGGGRQLTGDVLLRLFRSPAPPARRLAVNRAPLRPCPQPQSWTQHLVPTRWSPFLLQGQGQQPLLWTGPLQVLRENEPLPPQPREGLRPGRLEPPPGLGHPRLRWPRRGPRQERRQYRRPQAGPEPSQHDRSISQRVISQRQTARFTCGTGRGQGGHGQMHARCGPQQSELVFACGENTHSVGVGRPAALQARAARKHARRRSRRMHCAPRSAAIGCGATTKKAVEGQLSLSTSALVRGRLWQRCAHRRRTPPPHLQGLDTTAPDAVTVERTPRVARVATEGAAQRGLRPTALLRSTASRP